MRLVSQDGTVDVPYEKSAIYCSDGRISALFNDRCLAMASYSSIKKCEKVMEMLRKQYSKFEVSKVIACGSAEIMSKQLTQPKVEETITQFWDITIFQFPKDEEIEV